MNDRNLMIVAVLIVAIVIAGEAYIYCNDWDSVYDIGFSDEGDITVTIRADASIEYDIVTVNNGSAGPSSRTVLYYDGSYGEALDGTHHATGGTYLGQEYYMSQLGIQLDNRGVSSETMDADGLRGMMETAIASGRCDQSVVMASGAIPDTVYSGNEMDIIVRWIEAGGRLYWVGGIIGQYVSSSDGTVRDLGTDRQTLFLGAARQNTEASFGYSGIDAGWIDALSLSGNGTKYGVDASGIAGTLAMGYTDGTYSSICLVGNGSGTVCILGGILSNDQRSDLAQIVSSGVTEESKLESHIHGSVTRGTETETLKLDRSTGNIMVYAYLGGYFTVYGRSASVR